MGLKVANRNSGDRVVAKCDSGWPEIMKVEWTAKGKLADGGERRTEMGTESERLKGVTERWLARDVVVRSRRREE